VNIVNGDIGKLGEGTVSNGLEANENGIVGKGGQ
jgi:hypothetical protein